MHTSSVPITFPNQPHANATAPTPTAISPSPRWRGSPMSYKMFGSLGNRFYPTGTSPGPLCGPLDSNDYKLYGGFASSIESEHGRMLKALHGDDNLGRDDLSQNYACCGLDLQDLHALIEHFEEQHVVVVDSDHTQSALDPDAMELDDDSGPSSSSSSPPSTPPLHSVAAFETAHLRSASSGGIYHASPAHSRQHSPHLDSTRAEAFNQYASYSDFSSLMPGAVLAPQSESPAPNAKCIPPALLFSPSSQNTPTGTPSGSRVSSPAPHRNTVASLPQVMKKHAAPHDPAAPRPSATGLPVSKPFRCPTVGCNKSYKQANGLKYHTTHGQCNFMPRDPALEGLNDHEADQKARPYVCQVGTCTRRYKNMNGLRYHYQHSGAHGAVGLALLASGQHSLQTGTKESGSEYSLDQYPSEAYQQQLQVAPPQPPQQQPQPQPHLAQQHYQPQQQHHVAPPAPHPHFQHHLLQQHQMPQPPPQPRPAPLGQEMFSMGV